MIARRTLTERTARRRPAILSGASLTRGPPRLPRSKKERERKHEMSLMKRERRSAWPLETLWSQELVDGAVRDMLRNFFAGDGVLERVFDGGTHVLRVEELLEDDICVIRAELPGIDPEKDVEISIADGILRLSAERKEHSEEDLPEGYRSEFHYGRLARSIRLPEGATDADVIASYKDGILEVRVPAPKPAAPAAPVQIPISRA